MSRTPSRNANGLWFAAVVFASMALIATWKNNQEIAQRRLQDPVETVGTVRSAKCASFRHGFGIKPSAGLVYEYSTDGDSRTRHQYATSKWFDTRDDCQEFIRTMKSHSPIWYERRFPDRATFYPAEPDSWGFLFWLIPSAIFFWLGLSVRRPVEKKSKKSRSRKPR